MNNKKIQNIFDSTSAQQVFTFLCSRPHESFFEKEISDKTGLSRGATNIALRRLAEAGLIKKEKKGRMSFYSVTLSDPRVRGWKILNNILKIQPVVTKLRKWSEKITLFGSAAEGTNIPESDVDIFVLTPQPEIIKEYASKLKNTQLIVKKPLEFAEMEKKDPIFYSEVSRGIVLWEKKE
ncbi:nucleotidyltransferase domain-containing protein [candidate division WOR-3 bacterium]|nr:nucleotidyltransferase domain-containing protein [candidate division WOR-3 bacterium]